MGTLIVTRPYPFELTHKSSDLSLNSKGYGRSPISSDFGQTQSSDCVTKSLGLVRYKSSDFKKPSFFGMRVYSFYKYIRKQYIK